MSFKRTVRRLAKAALGRTYGGRRDMERFYSTEHDPFGFDSNPYETSKYDALLAAVGPDRRARGLEVGCAIGTLTERLAAVCDLLVAVDISQQAVDRTRERVGGLDHVRVERRTFPGELPTETFDLIVCSDVLYYLPPRRLVPALERLATLLEPGGSIVSLHWLGEHGAPTSGQQVHDLQKSTWADLQHVTADHHEGVGPFGAGFRLDRFDRPRSA